MLAGENKALLRKTRGGKARLLLDIHSFVFAAMKIFSPQSIRFKGILSLCKLWMFTMFFVSRCWWNTGKRSKGTASFQLHTITSNFLHEAEREPLKAWDQENYTRLTTQEIISKVCLALKLSYSYRPSTPQLHPFIPCLAWLQLKKEPIFPSIPFYLSFREMPWALLPYNSKFCQANCLQTTLMPWYGEPCDSNLSPTSEFPCQQSQKDILV